MMLGVKEILLPTDAMECCQQIIEKIVYQRIMTEDVTIC